MSAADEAVATALARADARAAATPRVDYRALNAAIKKQMSDLKKAVARGDKDAVVLLVQEHVRTWNQPGWMWPDDWPTWQQALDTVLSWQSRIDLRDLA